MEKKYVVYGGHVDSPYGGTHFIPAYKVAARYGVDLRECVIAPSNLQGWEPPEGLIDLRPRSDGQYK